MTRYCPIPMPDGSDCWRNPEPDGYAGICTEHMHAIATAWVGDPLIQRIRCQECMTINVIRDRLAKVLLCEECGHVSRLDGTPDWQTTDIDSRNLGTHAPDPAYLVDFTRPRTDVVYYIRFGDRVKIGTTSNLPKRLEVLPHDEVLAIEPGNFSREKSRHGEFAAQLIPGQREWFTITPALLGHCAALRQKFGPPMSAWRAWSSRAAA